MTATTPAAPHELRAGWLVHHRTRASAKSPLGEALAYIAKYRDGLGRFLIDGHLEIDTNTVKRLSAPSP